MAREEQMDFTTEMDFPNTFDEFVENYGFKDKNEIYTNGSELIPVFRVKQWLEHISTTKKDLVVREFEEIDVTYPPEEICIYPEYKGKPYFAIKYKENGKEIVGYGTYNPEVFSRYLKDYFIPPVTPQESQSFRWCETCKEYDQEKHCCHRYSKVIRNTVDEMKQEYIEREVDVLDKIREEIKVMISNSGFLSYSVRYIHKEIDKVFDNYKGGRL